MTSEKGTPKVMAPNHPVVRAYTRPTRGFLALLPHKFVPYAELMRVEKPAGFFTALWPHMFGTLYAACIINSPFHDLLMANTILFFGSFFLRSGACTWNDTVDAPFDRQVSRTRNRPIARRAVGSADAIVFAALQGMICLVLLLELPDHCFWYAIPSVIGLIFYPFAKRVMDVPQLVLALTCGWGILIGITAMGMDPVGDAIAIISHKSAPGAAPSAVQLANALTLPISCFCLYLANVSWTLIYDTVYGHQDSTEDAAAGVKSIVLTLSNNTKPLLAILTAIQTLLFSIAGWGADFGFPYFAGAVVAMAVSLVIMILKVDTADKRSCGFWFQRGVYTTGTLILFGFAGEYARKAL
ncbi:4-hydroxybenzoate polyprenyl transferase [Patellaria atrata CBS 101060]|uniref:4-hydroxybenzoate polyprenyltransferase, mitochondrial n=1 Tax=Patellaria atrata CBS 101060 TaxID=1346257 RepID=A0A9P4S2W6_9PEZI|nr:4-hydroxybenzoate polyprenyl transferase [Patellaria atrata CBS 101060]